MRERALYTARTDDLVVQELGDELLIYDRMWDVAHSLTETAARVWRACEGGATRDEIIAALVAEGVGEISSREEAAAIVERALTELEEKGLLAEPGGGVSRRHALRKLAGIGAGALAAPLVVSAAVPRPAEAFASPAICVAIGSACTTANTYGSTTGNNCCGPGTKTCSAAIGAGTGGCYCNSSKVCANCTASAVKPAATCGDGTCATKSASNRCCCSGVCSSTTASRCA